MDGVAFSMEASLVGVVRDTLDFAIAIGIGVTATHYHDIVRLVLLIENLLHLAVLITRTAVLSLIAVGGNNDYKLGHNSKKNCFLLR